MKRLGITGGIGSGKSVVSEVFRCLGIPTYDADSASKRLITTQEPLIKALKSILGADIYTSEGLDKKRMAQLIFNDVELLEKVNAVIHPAVFEDFKNWSLRQKAGIVACETAILFECGMNEQVDYAITVTASLDTRINRCVKRDHASEEQIKARIANQMDQEEKAKRSDYIVDNNGEMAILPQIRKIIEEINKA
ncbi:MAG: dephospho-CoA kinase [Paludibacteraceae bacterium]|nr:dephospho-CoA kinase [Paludibacteraceae bacterium]